MSDTSSSTTSSPSLTPETLAPEPSAAAKTMTKEEARHHPEVLRLTINAMFWLAGIVGALGIRNGLVFLTDIPGYWGSIAMMIPLAGFTWTVIKRNALWRELAPEGD